MNLEPETRTTRDRFESIELGHLPSSTASTTEAPFETIGLHNEVSGTIPELRKQIFVQKNVSGTKGIPSRNEATSKSTVLIVWNIAWWIGSGSIVAVLFLLFQMKWDGHTVTNVFSSTQNRVVWIVGAVSWILVAAVETWYKVMRQGIAQRQEQYDQEQQQEKEQ